MNPVDVTGTRECGATLSDVFRLYVCGLRNRLATDRPVKSTEFTTLCRECWDDECVCDCEESTVHSEQLTTEDICHTVGNEVSHVLS